MNEPLGVSTELPAEADEEQAADEEVAVAGAVGFTFPKCSGHPHGHKKRTIIFVKNN